jgi:hypothetical protein
MRVQRPGHAWRLAPREREQHMTPQGIRTECASCGTRLHAHNVTGLCAECKLIARRRRLGQPTDTSDPVSHEDALTNLTTILRATIIATGVAT